MVSRAETAPPITMADKPSLTDLGYKWVPGPSSSPNDFELRQIADDTQK